MKKKMIWVALFMFAVLAAAQENQADAEQQKAMEAYMKAGAFTENHEFLQKYVGNWDCMVKSWTAPGQPPQVSKGSFSGEMKLDGRFLFMSFKGEMLGQPFAGIQIIGFDNMQEKYITLWIDNSSTFFFLTTGARTGDVISETGLWPDPVSGEQMPVKARTTWISDDEYVYEQFMLMPDKSELKGMEMTCKRQK